ncbi:uroporphyrinogen-III C-methyltransferase [Porticoccus sp.]
MNNDKPITPDDNQATAANGERGRAGSVQAPAETAPSEPETTQSSAAPRAQNPGKSASKSSAAKGWLIVVLLLIAGGASVWWWFYGPSPQWPGGADQVQSVRQDDLTRLEQQLSAEVDARKALAALVEKNNAEQQLAMSAQARRLRELSGASRTDWLLAEAEYLLRLGNQRLLTERNSENALALLISADDILRELDEVQLLPVREALARNIVALKSQSPVDREGLFLQLKVLAEQVVSLPILAPKMSSPDQAEPLPAPPEGADAPWYTPLVKVGRLALAEAEKLILVRRRSDPVDPLLSPEQEQLLRLQLGAVLEQAQLAVLREEPQVYQASLGKARELLATYFQLNDRHAQALLAQLAELETQQITRVRPDISEGLNALRDYIDSWHNRHQVEQGGGAQQ